MKPPESASAAARLFSGTPAGLGPEVRAGVASISECDQAADAACQGAGIDGRAAACFRALVLLWNDHLDEAHALVQDLPGADAAFVHGIMHRREPDYSNAQYWFHRVGRHAAFPAVAEARVLAAEPAVREVLSPGGRWDPMAFIQSVARAAGGRDTAQRALLGEVQRAEFVALGDHLLGA